MTAPDGGAVTLFSHHEGQADLFSTSNYLGRGDEYRALPAAQFDALLAKAEGVEEAARALINHASGLWPKSRIQRVAYWGVETQALLEALRSAIDRGGRATG